MFRNKALDERKAYIKKNPFVSGAVHHVPMSLKTVTNLCNARSRYSKKHPSVLHPGPAPWKPDVHHLLLQMMAGMSSSNDERRNKSLGRKEFFEHFNIKGDGLTYTLKTCSGVFETTWWCDCYFIVELWDGNTQIPWPTLIECDMLKYHRQR